MQTSHAPTTKAMATMPGLDWPLTTAIAVKNVDASRLPMLSGTETWLTSDNTTGSCEKTLPYCFRSDRMHSDTTTAANNHDVTTERRRDSMTTGKSKQPECNPNVNQCRCCDNGGLPEPLTVTAEQGGFQLEEQLE